MGTRDSLRLHQKCIRITHTNNTFQTSNMYLFIHRTLETLSIMFFTKDFERKYY